MTSARSTIVTKLIVAATLLLFMVARHPGVLRSAETIKATTAVKHKALKHFVAKHRLRVEAKVTDPQGVSLVRCYFRAVGQADYVFVGMKAGEKDTFSGALPAPSPETKAIEYLFLAVNGRNQVVKTQTFRTESRDTTEIPSWQIAGAEGTIAVSTELPLATTPRGFTDSITADTVESSVRFGYVAGIYIMTQFASDSGATGAAVGAATEAAAGNATGAAATAVSAGTVSATAGLSTMVIVGTGAAAIVVAAAFISGGGDDGGSGHTTVSGIDILGTWQLVSHGGESITFSNDGSFVWATNLGERLSGSWSLAGNSLSLTMPGWSASGTVIDANTITLLASDGFTLNLSR